MHAVNCKAIAEKIIDEVRSETELMDRKPVLAMFLVGEDPSSETYIHKKEEQCVRAGIKSRKIVLSENITHRNLLAEIDRLNGDVDVDAILIQLPLPKQIIEREALERIDPEKDVDCLHPLNFGLFCEYGSEEARVIPVTALAVMKILKECNAAIKGKDAVVVGSSNIAGKPIALMLVEKGATTVICHDKTRDLKRHTRNADILVVAAGKKHLITKNMVKSGTVVIDVGVNQENGIIRGDVDFDNVSEVALYVTPVPGGVGLVTVATLLKNVLRLSRKK
ncbi:MAG: bifunctional 5,10-methylenetetrahydrofolate dehydrogenase/5,10-methenyltetrahydrofolate cyclohydrolase [Patescibacteria group bacterium]|nr:bifunctional 5,10-methylenetetrahydrofolate dehydrogenase/5,10-methenyltetrahydrofolate cyclohydrolase [Patescibacteria group bacterium]